MEDYNFHIDSNLIIQLKSGSHSAYTKIYDRYFHLMFVFAYKKLRNEELAKDFTQELFTTLWNKKESLNENGKLSSYLYISLRSRILDYFQHQKVETKYIDFLSNYSTTTTEATDHLIRERELTEYIDKQIQALPKKMRKIFELSRKGNLTHKQIAEQLETSEHNVSKQIGNALKIFKTKFGTILNVLLP